MVREVKVLGPGCTKCKNLEKVVSEVIESLGLSIEVGHVTDMEEILAYGVMSVPALVIDDAVVSTGRILSKTEITKLLKG